MIDERSFFDEQLLNEWALSMPTDGFRPLGDPKLNKLCDFLSSLDVYQQLVIDGFKVCEIRDYLYTQECHDKKHYMQWQRTKDFATDLKLASKIFTYYKKIIDSADIFPMQSFDGIEIGLIGFKLTEEEKRAIEDKKRKKYFAELKKEKKKAAAKPTKSKKKKAKPKTKAKNVISMADYKERKTA